MPVRTRSLMHLAPSGSWSLALLLAPLACAPHPSHDPHASTTDACTSSRAAATPTSTWSTTSANSTCVPYEPRRLTSARQRPPRWLDRSAPLTAAPAAVATGRKLARRA